MHRENSGFKKRLSVANLRHGSGGLGTRSLTDVKLRAKTHAHTVLDAIDHSDHAHPMRISELQIDLTRARGAVARRDLNNGQESSQKKKHSCDDGGAGVGEDLGEARVQIGNDPLVYMNSLEATLKEDLGTGLGHGDRPAFLTRMFFLCV